MAAIEGLESRRLLSGSGYTAYPTFVFAAGSSPSAPFSPIQITTAYGIGNISFGSIAGNGAGETIAIVDAYNDPDIKSDVTEFNTLYDLQQFNVAGGPTFTVENQQGQTTSLPSNATPGNWDIEESLDVEWAHTVAPMANIILFEANSNGTDLYTAVAKAASTPGVSIVSMSWGGGESSDETSYDSYFVTPAGQTGVTFLASTGDTAEPSNYPAYSPNVIAVGGTSLTIASDGTYGSETAWADSGGGISAYESQPSYQVGKVNGLSSTQRTAPDVAWLADPKTGVDVYDSYYTLNSNHIYQVGGTSLACPMWAGLIAIADQGRAVKGETPLDGRSQTLPLLYNLPSNDFHDITSGSNGYSASAGYDLVTGLGTPIPAAVVSGLINVPTVYVDNAATGLNDGSSWSNAYTSLSAALSNVIGGDQIDVAQGTYYPGSARTSTFSLVSGVDIYGGFAGVGTANPNAQNPSLYPTILSGDIGTAGVNTDNVYHVVTATSVSAGTLLDGFTITLGYANGSSTNADGAGLYVVGQGPVVMACTFFENTATADGGGAYISENNSTRVLGSGLFFDCAFISNIASLGAGDTGFEAVQDFINCTFTNNDSNSQGRAIYQDYQTLTVVNCILWGDTGTGGAEINSVNSATVNVTYSDVQGGYSGTGNINSNPLFIQSPNGSSEGNLELSSDSPAIDVGNNSGVPPFMITDAAGNPHIVDYPGTGASTATVDMGAYEAQVPTVLSATLPLPAANEVTVQFSQNVSGSLTASDLAITTLAGGPAPSVSGLVYNAATNTATFSFSGTLQAGIYQIDIGAAGAHLSSDDIFGVLFLPANSSLALSSQQAYTVQEFYIDPSATLDIGTSAIVIPYSYSSPASTVAALITAAFNNGAWNGAGITSSDISLGSAVGYFDSGSSVTIRLTWDGDANLNGTVDSDDLSLVLLGQVNNGTRWQDGDFNYQGKITADDWSLLELGAAVSNGQAINSASLLGASLPATALSSSAPSISAASIFSNVQAVLKAGDSSILQ